MIIRIGQYYRLVDTYESDYCISKVVSLNPLSVRIHKRSSTAWGKVVSVVHVSSDYFKNDGRFTVTRFYLFKNYYEATKT